MVNLQQIPLFGDLKQSHAFKALVPLLTSGKFAVPPWQLPRAPTQSPSNPASQASTRADVSQKTYMAGSGDEKLINQIRLCLTVAKLTAETPQCWVVWWPSA